MKIPTLRGFISIVGVLAIVAGLVVPLQTAAAQAGGSRQIINGQTISWNAEWALAPDVSFVDQDIELVAFNRGASVAGYGATSFAVPGNQLRDVLLEGFTSEAALQQVDRGSYNNVSYSLDISQGTGFTLALFTLVIESANSTTMAVLIDDVTQFQNSMQAAQVGITISGSPIFDGVDAAVMQQHLTNATGAQPATDTTAGSTQVTPAPPQPTPTPEPTPTPVASGPDATAGTGTLIGDLNSGLGGQRPAPDESGGQPAPDTADAMSNSVTLADSGVEIGYSDDWAIETEEPGRVQFASTGELLVISAFLDLTGADSGVAAMPLAESLLTTPDLNAAEIVDARDLENGRKLIILVDRDPAGDIYLIYDIVTGPTATTAFMIVVDTTSIGTAVDLAQSTLQVDGQPVLSNIREIAPAIFAPAS